MSRPAHGTVLVTQKGKYGRVDYEVLAPELDDAKGRIAAEIINMPAYCEGPGFRVGSVVFIDPRDIGPGKLRVLQDA